MNDRELDAPHVSDVLSVSECVVDSEWLASSSLMLEDTDAESDSDTLPLTVGSGDAEALRDSVDEADPVWDADPPLAETSREAVGSEAVEDDEIVDESESVLDAVALERIEAVRDRLMVAVGEAECDRDALRKAVEENELVGLGVGGGVMVVVMLCVVLIDDDAEAALRVRDTLWEVDQVSEESVENVRSEND